MEDKEYRLRKTILCYEQELLDEQRNMLQQEKFLKAFKPVENPLMSEAQYHIAETLYEIAKLRVHLVNMKIENTQQELNQILEQNGQT